MLPQLLRELIIDQAIAPINVMPEEPEPVINSSHKISSLQRQNFSLAGGASHDGRATGSFSHARIKIENSSKRLGVTSWNLLLSRKDNWTGDLFLLRTKDLEIAQELYFRIQRRSSPAELAENTARSEAQTGGIVGPVELSTPSSFGPDALCEPGGSSLASDSLGRMASDCTRKFYPGAVR